MKYRIFEQTVKSSLQNAEEAVDIAQLWSAVKPKEKNRKPLFWWFFTGFFVAGTAMATWMGANFFASSFNTPDLPPAGNQNQIIATTDHYRVNKSANQSLEKSTNPSLAILQTEKAQIKNTKLNQNTLTSNTTNQIVAIEADQTQLETLPTAATESAAEIRSQEAVSFLQRTEPAIAHHPVIALNRDVQCPTFRKNRSMKMSLIPEIGYFRPLKSLTAESNVPTETFALRKAGEKSLEGLQAALYARLQRPGANWGISTGLHYSRLSERMNLEYSYIKRDTTQGIISITVSQTGDTITTIYGDIITESRVTGTTRAHYYLSTFDIPLSLFYEKDFESWAIGAEAGVYFNLALASKGKILNSANDFIDVKSAAAFKSSLGVSGFAGLYLKKPLGPGNLIFSLRGRFIPSAFNTQGYGTVQKYQFAGAHLGYEFRF
jgi:hypothetical protein